MAETSIFAKNEELLENVFGENKEAELKQYLCILKDDVARDIYLEDNKKILDKTHLIESIDSEPHVSIYTSADFKTYHKVWNTFTNNVDSYSQTIEYCEIMKKLDSKEYTKNDLFHIIDLEKYELSEETFRTNTRTGDNLLETFLNKLDVEMDSKYLISFESKIYEQAKHYEYIDKLNNIKAVLLDSRVTSSFFMSNTQVLPYIRTSLLKQDTSSSISFRTRTHLNNYFSFDASFTLSKKVYCFSEFLAELSETKYMPIEMKLNLLGFTKTRIKNLLKEIKKLKLNITILGVGGIGFNLIKNLKEMCIYADVNDLFERILIIDNDKLELTNLPRLNTSLFLNSTDNDLLKVSLARQEIEEDKSYFNVLTNRFVHYYSNRLDKNCLHLVENSIIIGAPDLETRNMLFENNCDFFSFTHQNDLFRIFHKPKLCPAIMNETYGKIRLPVFYFNILLGTINLLETLIQHKETPYEDDFMVLEKSVLDDENFTKQVLL